MADTTATSMVPASTPGKTDELDQSPEQLASFWLAQIEFSEKKVKQWRKRGEQIVRRYKNRKQEISSSAPTIAVGQKRMNFVWANVQTQKPILYAQTPKPNVTRRNKDKDPVGRWAATVLERVLANTLDMQDFDHVLNQDIENLLLPGYACSMVEYVPQVEGDQVGWQEARLRYVHWKDQLTNPARYWQEVWWWGYVSYLTRAEVRKAYGNKVATAIVLDHKATKDADDSMSKATVWCIWDSKQKKVIHISTGYAHGPLGIYDPPVNFEDFFPIPRPLFATTATDSTIPVPDLDQYQDQVDEIDLLTQRIYVLTRSLRVRGLYPGDMESIKQAMDSANDADLIPIPNWAMLGERGGANNLIAYFPVDMIAKVLEWCYTSRDKAIQAMYEVTGISDIKRGQTDPNETLGAQKLKSQFSDVRTRERQRDVQRYIRQILLHMSSIIGQHFELPVIQKMSGVPLLTQQQAQMLMQAQQAWQQFAQAQQAALEAAQNPNAPQMAAPQPPGIPQPDEDMLEMLKEPTWEMVMSLLRDEKLRGFIIDVETDSTIEADQTQQQQKAEAFLTAVTQYCAAWAQILPAAPDLADLAGEMLISAARLFKMGDSLESVIEEAVEKMEKKADQPPAPNPQMQGEQAKAQAEVAKAQASIQEAQVDHQTAHVKAQAEAQKAELEVVQATVDHHANMHKVAADIALTDAKADAAQRTQGPTQ
jgi:hypothetical protein